MKKIGIVMGSDSDLPVVEKAMATLEKFGVPFEAHVYSAHRTPVEASEFAKGARETALVPLSQQPAKRHIWQVLWQQTQHFL